MIARDFYEHNTDRPSNEPLVLHLDRSKRIHFIAQVIQQRQTNRRRSNVEKLESLKKEESKDFCAATAGGLPSPPVESPECMASEILSIAERSSTPESTTPELTRVEICQRLEELKEEKHQLFQLIKRLMFEEAQEERRRRRSTMPSVE